MPPRRPGPAQRARQQHGRRSRVLAAHERVEERHDVLELSLLEEGGSLRLGRGEQQGRVARAVEDAVQQLVRLGEQPLGRLRLAGLACVRRRPARGPGGEQRGERHEQAPVRPPVPGDLHEAGVRGGQVLGRLGVDARIEGRRLGLAQPRPPVEELVEGEGEVRGDARQQRHVGQALAELPLRDGRLRHTEVARELLLRDAALAAAACDRARDVDVLHAWLPCV